MHFRSNDKGIPLQLKNLQSSCPVGGDFPRPVGRWEMPPVDPGSCRGGRMALGRNLKSGNIYLLPTFCIKKKDCHFISIYHKGKSLLNKIQFIGQSHVCSCIPREAGSLGFNYRITTTRSFQTWKRFAKDFSWKWLFGVEPPPAME